MFKRVINTREPFTTFPNACRRLGNNNLSPCNAQSSYSRAFSVHLDGWISQTGSNIRVLGNNARQGFLRWAPWTMVAGCVHAEPKVFSPEYVM
jgi:hypothetical protein